MMFSHTLYHCAMVPLKDKLYHIENDILFSKLIHLLRLTWTMSDTSPCLSWNMVPFWDIKWIFLASTNKTFFFKIISIILNRLTWTMSDTSPCLKWNMVPRKVITNLFKSCSSIYSFFLTIDLMTLPEPWVTRPPASTGTWCRAQPRDSAAARTRPPTSELACSPCRSRSPLPETKIYIYIYILIYFSFNGVKLRST